MGPIPRKSKRDKEGSEDEGSNKKQKGEKKKGKEGARVRLV